MNYLNNRISTEIEVADFTEMKGIIETLEGKLDFLIGLTKKERMTLPKISRSNKLFVEDTVQVIQGNKELFPAYINLDEIKRDYQLFLQLGGLLQSMTQLTEKLRDTQILAGSEAYAASLSCYKFLQIAVENGIPGTENLANKLSARFKKNSSNETTEPVETSSDEELDFSTS